MDALVLIGSFAALMLLGMPVAYALGLAALLGGLWIELPLDAIMIQIASGVNKFSLLPSPVLCWPAPSWQKAAWRADWLLLPVC